MPELTVVDLFSGSGAMSVGLELAGFRTVAFCENDRYCRRWLRHAWPGVPIFGDIRRLTRGRLELVLGERAEGIHLLAGGPPCQPASTAGLRRGADDDRWLWPEALRLVEELRPRWCIFENPVGFLSLVQYPGSPPVDGEGYALAEEGDVYMREGPGLASEIMGALERLEYGVQPVVIPACGVEAMHERYRVWIVAHRDSARPARGPAPEHEKGDAADLGSQDVADTEIQPERPGLATRNEGYQARRRRLDNGGSATEPSGSLEPGLGLSVDGPAALVARYEILPVAPYGAEQYPWESPRLIAGKAPNRRQRLQALGNAVFWPVVYELGRAIMQAEEGF